MVMMVMMIERKMMIMIIWMMIIWWCWWNGSRDVMLMEWFTWWCLILPIDSILDVMLMEWNMWWCLWKTFGCDADGMVHVMMLMDNKFWCDADGMGQVMMLIECCLVVMLMEWFTRWWLWKEVWLWCWWNGTRDDAYGMKFCCDADRMGHVIMLMEWELVMMPMEWDTLWCLWKVFWLWCW